MGLDLFEVESDGQRKRQLKRIHLWAKMFFIFGIGTGLFNLFSSYKLFKFYSNFPDPPSDIFKIQSVANIIFLSLYGLMLPLQAYFFYLFVAKSKRAVLYDNPQEFNSSLQWLLKQTVVGTILFGINTVWAVINIIIIR